MSLVVFDRSLELPESYQLIAYHYYEGGAIVVVAWQSYVREENGNVNEFGEVYDQYFTYDARNGQWWQGAYLMKTLLWTHLGWVSSPWHHLWNGPVTYGIMRRINQGTLELVLSINMSSPWTEAPYLNKRRFWLNDLDVTSGLGVWEAQE